MVDMGYSTFPLSIDYSTFLVRLGDWPLWALVPAAPKGSVNMVNTLPSRWSGRVDDLSS